MEDGEIRIEPDAAPLWDLVWDVAPALARANPELWLGKMFDAVCTRYGLDEISQQSDLFEKFDGLFAAAVRRFRAELNQNDLKRLRGFEKGANCFQWLMAKLRMGKSAPVVEMRRGVARVLPSPRERRELAKGWRALELREFELWDEFKRWPKREQKLFRVGYPRALMSKDGATLYFKLSVRSFARKLECSERTVKSALCGLRRRGVMGVIVMGNQWTGSTVHWIARSVKSVRWGRVARVRRRGWQRKPPKQREPDGFKPKPPS